MISFEKFLIDNGWTTSDIGPYSSLGTVQKKYLKDGKEILIGLSEKGKPVTLISPRPSVIRVGWNGTINHVFPDDDLTNRILQVVSNERILESLFNPARKFFL